MAAPGPGRGVAMSRPKWMEEAETAAREKARRAGREDAEAPLAGPLALIDGPSGGPGGGAGPVVWAGTGKGRVAVRLGALGGRGGEQKVLTAVGAPPGEISAGHCRVQGPAISGGMAGGPVLAQLTAHDGSGRRIYEGGANVRCRVFPATGPPGGPPAAPPVEAEVTDKEDGCYMLQFTVVAGGDYRVHVEVNGDALPGSPYQATFKGMPVVARPSEPKADVDNPVLKLAAEAAGKVSQALAAKPPPNAGGAGGPGTAQTERKMPPHMAPMQGAHPPPGMPRPGGAGPTAGVPNLANLQAIAARIDAEAKEAAAARAAASINSRLASEDRGRDRERRQERNDLGRGREREALRGDHRSGYDRDRREVYGDWEQDRVHRSERHRRSRSRSPRR